MFVVVLLNVMTDLVKGIKRQTEQLYAQAIIID